MTFGNRGVSGQHFRGKYSQDKPAPSALPQELARPESPQEQIIPEEQPSTYAQPRSEPSPARQSESLAFPLLSFQRTTVIAVIVVAGGIAILSSVISNQPEAQVPLSWQSSCGSPPVSGSSWWPVLGPAAAVETVRSRYCGDAFVTAGGAVQVASFSSHAVAVKFAQRLATASGYSFRVGQPRTP